MSLDSESKVQCYRCKKEFRATNSHINLICKECQKKEKGEFQMSEEIKKRFNELIEKGRELSGKEIGIISALMEHEHLLVQQYEKEIKELITDFLKKINGYLESDIDDAIGYFIKIREEYRRKLNEKAS